MCGLTHVGRTLPRARMCACACGARSVGVLSGGEEDYGVERRDEEEGEVQALLGAWKD